MFLWIVVAVLAGSTLGAYTALLFGGKLSLVGLENPLVELRRPVKDSAQTLRRLPWILGYMVTQSCLIAVAVLAYAVAFLSLVAAGIGLITGFVFLIALAFGDPTTPWLMVLSCFVFGLVYCLSAFVGQDLLAEKEESEDKEELAD